MVYVPKPRLIAELERELDERDDKDNRRQREAQQPQRRPQYTQD